MEIITDRIENNTYFVSKGSDCIVIDPSMEYKQITEHIKVNGYNVKAILITHAHYDHVYSLYELVRDTKAPVYMHKDDFPLYDASIPMTGSANKVEIDYPLNGGEALDILGEKIEVVHTPGHAEGCVCYIIGDSIFTGDFIFKGTVGRTDLPTSNKSKMNDSLNKFSKLDRDLKVYAGHGEDSTYYDEMNTNPFLIRYK